ncbi:hypothetical protein HD596_000619 [Nonomuraea jabiensis]|uniref:Uncharacterized protein n=1 Tax=Nonomuraea jabiensis TaxID=882448 RepID=A0A7W9L7U4_9ACTN|nr:hypothetical protein [Nonomuraea jabiensis]
MNRDVYSIVHCLPDPRTGEFVNIGPSPEMPSPAGG